MQLWGKSTVMKEPFWKPEFLFQQSGLDPLMQSVFWMSAGVRVIVLQECLRTKIPAV